MLDKNKIYTILCTKKVTLFSVKSWVHGIIRIWSKSPFDHVAFVFYENGRWMVAEATTGKVRILTLENWFISVKTNAYIQNNSFATKKRNEMIYYAYKCEGVKKYDFLGLIWMFIYIKRKVWLGSKNKAKQNQREFCSEFFFNAMGLNEKAQYKTPHDAFLFGEDIIGQIVDVDFNIPFLINKTLWQ